MTSNKATKINMDMLTKALTVDEGLRLNEYRCTAGHRTIGVGHNVDASPLLPIIGRNTTTISLDESNTILEHDINIVIRGLNKYIPWFNDLNAVSSYVLINMAFNMGIGGLLKFKNTLAAIKDNNIPLIVAGMSDSTWAKQVPNRANRLIECIKYNRLPS